MRKILTFVFVIGIILLSLNFVSCCKKTCGIPKNYAGNFEVQRPPIEKETTEIKEVEKPSKELNNETNTNKKVLVDVYVYFDFDSYNFTEDAKYILKENSKLILDNSKDIDKIIIEGYCDERGTEQYNLCLGQKRADTVREYLVNYGIRIKIETISYGENKPNCNEHNEACWQANRKTVIRTIPKTSSGCKKCKKR